MANKRRHKRQSKNLLELNLPTAGNQSQIMAEYSMDKYADDSTLTEPNSWAGYLRRHWWLVGLIVFLSLGVFGAGLKHLEEAAHQQKVEHAALPNNSNNQNTSWLNTINPFVEPPLPTATPQLSKEYKHLSKSNMI